MSEPVSEALRERFLRHFFDAWPERDVADTDIRSTLKLSIESRDDGPMLVAELLGYTTGFGFSRGDALEPLVDDLAAHIAYNAEGDRWIGGQGWREYRPEDRPDAH